MSRVSIGLANEAATIGERVVTLPTGTSVMDPATYRGRLIQIASGTAAYSTTLPKASGSGDVYEFLSTVAHTTNSVVINAVDGDVFVGTVKNFGSGNIVTTFASTANDIITLNKTTTGGQRAGDYIKLQDVAAGVWRVVDANLFSSGTAATPFSGS